MLPVLLLTIKLQLLSGADPGGLASTTIHSILSTKIHKKISLSDSTHT